MAENTGQTTSAPSGSLRYWVTITPSSVALNPNHETNHLLLLDDTSVDFEEQPDFNISGASLCYDVRSKGLSYQGGSRWTLGGRDETAGIEVVRFEALSTIDQQRPEIFRVGAEQECVYGYLTKDEDAEVGEESGNGPSETGLASKDGGGGAGSESRLTVSFEKTIPPTRRACRRR